MLIFFFNIKNENNLSRLTPRVRLVVVLESMFVLSSPSYETTLYLRLFLPQYDTRPDRPSEPTARTRPGIDGIRPLQRHGQMDGSTVRVTPVNRQQDGVTPS